MSKTKKVGRLQRKVELLEKELSFANSEFIQRISRPVKFQTTPHPVFDGKSHWDVSQLNMLVEYIYKEMDNAYNMAYQMGEESVEDIKFVLYIDEGSYYDLTRVGGYTDFNKELDEDITFRVHKVVLVRTNEYYVHFARVK